MTPAVSVVMAVYNGQRFLPAQMRSVLMQLQPDDQLVVIDDASTDGSYRWLRELDDRRIELYQQQTNTGVLRSFECGLRKARNDIVFLCDQDDIWLPGKRTAVVSAFGADVRTLVVVSDAQLIDAADRVIAPSFMKTRGGFRSSLWQTLMRNRYLGCAMAVRRSLLDAALPIPRSVPMHDMWLGALASVLGNTHYLPQALLQYRRHGGNVSPSRHQGWWQMLCWRLALILAVGNRRLALATGRHAPSAVR